MSVQNVPTGPRYLIGAPNFRDMGGATTRNGQQLQHGQLFRSEGLGFLTDTDLDALRRLDIRLVCDLRSERERIKHPSRWPSPSETEWLLLNIFVDLRAGNPELFEILHRDPSAEGTRSLMLETYRMLPMAVATGMGRFIARLTNGAGPALIHCAAGKDRTGFICACILKALDVDQEQVYADYLLSGVYLDKIALAERSRETLEEIFGMHANPVAVELLTGVDADYLDASFETIDKQFGSFEVYLREEAGIEDSTLQNLRLRLLR